MALKLITGDTFKAEFDGVMAELKRNYLADRRAMHVVLVPDKFSLTMEKEVLESLNLEGSANVQVLSFLRFAGRAMKNSIKNCLTPQGVVMLLQKVINDVRDRLTVYKNASKTPSFANEMYASLTSLRNSGVTVQALRDALPRIKSQVLAEKTQDMAIILEAYLAELQSGYVDSTTRLEKFAGFIPSMPNVERTYFYVTDIYKFTAPEYDVLEALAKSSPGVTVGLPLGYGENKRLFPFGVKARIVSMCKNAGILLKEERASACIKPQFQKIVDNLYSYRGVLQTSAGGAIEISYADDNFSECEEAASKIAELINFSDYRYKDIAVVIPDEGYFGPVKSAFERFGIPHFVDESTVFTGLLPIKYLLSVLSYSSTQLTDDALEIVKNPLFTEGEDLTFDDVDAFENFILPFGADRMVFLKEFSGDEAAEKVRQTFLEKMPKFKKADTAENFTEKIEKFLSDDKFFQKVSSFAAEAKDAKIQKSFSQTESRLCSVFEEIKRTIGKSFMDFDDYLRVLTSTLESVKISLTPLYLDSVFVGTSQKSRFEGVKTMFVLGATASGMPEGVGNTAIISADDETLLSEAGIELSPTKMQQALSNMFYLAELIVRPTEKLIVSYPKTVLGAAMQPSTLIDQLLSLFSDLKVSEPRFGTIFERTEMSDEEKAREFGLKFGSRKNAYYHVLGEAKEAAVIKEHKKPYEVAFSLLTDEEKAAVNRYFDKTDEPKIADGYDLFFKDFSKGDYVTSVSQLEKYFACPLQNYFAYGLRLQKRVTDVIENSLTGSFIHEVLEKYFTLFAEGKLDKKTVKEDEIRKIVSEISDEVSGEKDFLAFTMPGKHKTGFTRLKGDCVKICIALTETIKNSSYNPYKLEAAFWNGSTDRQGNKLKNVYKPLTFTADGRTVSLRGKIDRIDVFENNFYVIDYKSYGKDISFQDVFFGTAIQLVAYMTAIEKEENKTPTGVFYLPVTVGYKAQSQAEEKRFHANGFFDCSYEKAAEMENSLRNLKVGQKISGKFLKNSFTAKTVKDNSETAGEIVRALNEKTGLDEDCELKITGSGAVKGSVLSSMGDYVTKLVERAISEIGGGYVEAKPTQKACDFCDYKDICQKTDLTYRKHPKVGAENFAAAVEEENE